MANRKKRRRSAARQFEQHRDRSIDPGESIATVSGKSPEFWQLAIFVAGVAFYFVLFFREFIPVAVGVHRFHLLSYLLTPDELVKPWFDATSKSIALADRIPIVLVAVLILGVAWGLGRFFLQACRIDHILTRLERSMIATGAGLNLLSLYTLIVGWIGWLHPASFAIPAFAAAIFVLVRLAVGVRRSERTSTGDRLSESTESTSPLGPTAVQNDPVGLNLARRFEVWPDALFIILGIPFVVLITLGSMLPPIEFDVREYHLQVPKEWFQLGRIEFLPHNIYGNMPLGAELHSLLAMVVMPGEDRWWWGALAGKTVIGSFAWLGALTLFAAGTRFFSTSAGIVAAVLYISIPWIGNVSMNGLVEGVWGYYFFTALYLIVIWFHIGRTQLRIPPRGFLVAAGFLAGAAVACKYPAVLIVVFPLVLLVYFGGHQIRRRSRNTGEDRFQPTRVVWKTTFVFLAAAACGCGPWFVKNWVLTGNPTYPLLYEVFDGETRNAEKNQQWVQAHRPPGFDIQQLMDSGSQILWRSPWLSPILIPLATLCMTVRKHRWIILLLLLLLSYFIATWWLLTHRIDRFLVPALPLVALVAGVGATWLKTRKGNLVLVGIVSCGLAFNFICFGSLVGDYRFFAPLRSLANDELTTIASHRYFNSDRFQGQKVLLVGDAQPFGLKVPVMYHTCFDDCIIEMLIQGRTEDARRSALREHGISHIYVDWDEIDRYRDTYGYSDYVQPEVFDELLSQGVLVIDEGWTSFTGDRPLPLKIVYRVVSGEESRE